MKNLILYLIILIALPVYAYLPEGENPLVGTVYGTIKDGATQSPVEFANIALYSIIDSSLVTGAITDAKGEFDLTNVPFGDYYLVVQFIGYEKKSLEDLVINKQQRSLDLGEIDLHLTAVQLQGAEIVANKVNTEYKLDRKVINVSQDISNTGSTAAEVLEKSPSVRVDVEGNVTLRGSSNFKVFIDGKPSVLDGNEALQQIPANTIENIEIITNPSVKYDPDGTAGIININLKKSRLKGFSGIADVTAATGDKYGADVYMNYKNRNWNIYGGIDWNDRVWPSTVEEERETYRGDTTDYRKATYDQAWRRHGINFKGGLDYYLGEKTTLSLGGEYGTGGFGWDRNGQVHDYTLPGTFDRYYLDHNIFRWSRNYYSISTNYQQKFKQEGHELKFLAFYSGRDGSQTQDKRETDTDPNWEPLTTAPFRLRSTEEGPSYNLRLEVDYVKPVFENGRIEAGYHFRLEDEHEDYFVENFDYDNMLWTRDEKYTKNASYYRSIQAIYGIFKNGYKDFEYQLGLRGEYTYRDIRVINRNEKSVVDRFDYFPSLHLSYRLKESNQFMGSYSRRIERPRSWYLEPYVTYVDESTRRMGDPGLLPEYTDSYELSYLKTLASGSFTIEAYFRKTSDKITWVNYYDADSGFFINTPKNLNHDQALGLESSFVYDFTRWFNLNLSGSYYHYQLQDLTGETSSYRSSNNWDTRVITSFSLPSQTRFQLNFAYDSPTVTAQGRSDGSWYMDFTAKQEFLQKSLSLTFKISDIFNSRQVLSYTYGTGFYSSQLNYPEARVLSLTLSYRLNNFKKNPAMDTMGGDGGM